MKIIDRKDAINPRLYKNKSFVETAIYRVLTDKISPRPRVSPNHKYSTGHDITLATLA